MNSYIPRWIQFTLSAPSHRFAHPATFSRGSRTPEKSSWQRYLTIDSRLLSVKLVSEKYKVTATKGLSGKEHGRPTSSDERQSPLPPFASGRQGGIQEDLPIEKARSPMMGCSVVRQENFFALRIVPGREGVPALLADGSRSCHRGRDALAPGKSRRSRSRESPTPDVDGLR